MWTNLLLITEAAAIAAAKWIGRGDEQNADQAAVNAMRQTFNLLDIDGTIVIGEGERDEAPMLFIGEKVGNTRDGTSPKFDIAVDPLEGTTICASASQGAMSVLAIAPENGLIHAPDIYMDKIAIGPELSLNGFVLDPYAPINTTLELLAKTKNIPIEDVVVAILKRDRNQEYINQVRSAGAKVMLLNDGDVAAAIATNIPNSGIDMYLGIGGAPEGVLAAVAIKGLGGQMCSKLIYLGDMERARAEKMGINPQKEYYNLNEIVKSDQAIFIASGVTSGYLLEGIETISHNKQRKYKIESIVVDCATKSLLKLQKYQPTQ